MKIIHTLIAVELFWTRGYCANRNSLIRSNSDFDRKTNILIYICARILWPIDFIHSIHTFSSGFYSKLHCITCYKVNITGTTPRNGSKMFWDQVKCSKIEFLRQFSEVHTKVIKKGRKTWAIVNFSLTNYPIVIQRTIPIRLRVRSSQNQSNILFISSHVRRPSNSLSYHKLIKPIKLNACSDESEFIDRNDFYLECMRRLRFVEFAGNSWKKHQFEYSRHSYFCCISTPIRDRQCLNCL